MILKETTQYPRKRAEKLTIQLVGAETLIYNETTHHAHCLDEVASAVWQQIDGRTSVEKIAASASLQL
ncbi:MAG: PqqD family protein, partial [Bryocella sp.]